MDNNIYSPQQILILTFMVVRQDFTEQKQTNKEAQPPTIGFALFG